MKPFPGYKLSRKEVEDAKAIAALEENQGWQALAREAQSLIDTYTPSVTQFTEGEAVQIASKLAFVNGIKRCLGLVEKSKEIIKGK